MPLRDLLIRIAAIYDATALASKDVPGQALLRSVKEREDLPLPPGFTADGHGGQGFASGTPWIGVYDPAINTEPHDGLYLAYIFSADLSAVTLTLQQGVTSLKKSIPRRSELRRELQTRAQRLRAALPPASMLNWSHQPVFGSGDWRPRSYEAGSVIARRYEIAKLPTEEMLAADLLEASKFLRDVTVAQRIHLQMPDAADPRVEYLPEEHSASDALDGFCPKDSSDYYVHIQGGKRRRTRRHEALIADFGYHSVTCGYTPIVAGMHPRDLVLRRGDGSVQRSWLVEGKTVKNGNTTNAVRQAVAQLFEYSHFWHEKRGELKPYLIALFTEGIGHYAEYLEDHGIGSVWRSGDGWGGSPRAASWGLVNNDSM
ncbi:MrcB family domain-containing protein [Streptomyces olindensis]|uniref:MrcB family domain-containing protein n=1 Tax=Streptomyces olindensis TaxID=358823 RepID=UPI003409E0EC